MAKVWKDYRKESRSGWGTDIEENEPIDRESIKLGVMLRIADATELMAQNYIKMQNELDQYKRWYARDQEEKARLAKRIHALRGVITRMKNKK